MRALLLPFLFLACPVMMIWCMRSMRGHGEVKSSEKPGATPEIAELRSQVAELREELSLKTAAEELNNMN